MIAPPLSHFHTLIPVVPAIVDSSDRIAVTMRECPLDCIRVPQSAFVKHGRCGRAQAVRRHFVLGETHAAESRVDGVLTHGPLPGVECREDVALPTGNRLELAE